MFCTRYELQLHRRIASLREQRNLATPEKANQTTSTRIDLELSREPVQCAHHVIDLLASTIVVTSAAVPAITCLVNR